MKTYKVELGKKIIGGNEVVKTKKRGMRIFTSKNHIKNKEGKYFAYLVEIPVYMGFADTEKEAVNKVVESFYADIKKRELREDPDFTNAAEMLMYHIYSCDEFGLIKINPFQEENQVPLN